MNPYSPGLSPLQCLLLPTFSSPFLAQITSYPTCLFSFKTWPDSYGSHHFSSQLHTTPPFATILSPILALPPKNLTIPSRFGLFLYGGNRQKPSSSLDQLSGLEPKARMLPALSFFFLLLLLFVYFFGSRLRLAASRDPVSRTFFSP